MMSFLYTQKKFHWTQAEFSNFRTFQTALYAVGKQNLGYVHIIS